MNKKIVVIDYELGNTCSVKNALDLLGYRVIVSKRDDELLTADALVLPGVGSFGEAMGNMARLGLIDILNELVIERKKPILGICLGMQVMTDCSEEDPGFMGLGWIKGEVNRIHTNGLKVPHVGWNNVTVHMQKPLFERNDTESYFYFDHSYRFVCPAEYVAATCTYGSEIIAAVQRGNIHGVQFHPEKSCTSGMKLFRSFFSHNNI